MPGCRWIESIHCREGDSDDHERCTRGVSSVEIVADYVLRLLFSDGTTREVDLGGNLWGSVFEPLRDPAPFAQVRVDHELGTIVWPNGADMDPVVCTAPLNQRGRKTGETRTTPDDSLRRTEADSRRRTQERFGW